MGAYYTARGYYDSDKNTVIATKELRPTYIHNADSIKIFPDGTMYIYGGDACFGPCNK